MAYYFFKVLLTAVIVVIATEVSKRDTLLGSLIVSIPLVSYLTFVWLYIDTGDVERVADLSANVFWLVLPSLSLFVILPWLLKSGLGFFAGLSIATVVMVVLYVTFVAVMKLSA